MLLRELSLASLDELSADALAVFIDERQRPLQGLAGLCDWRLCGQLSRVLATGFFRGEGGETLLMPTGSRLPVGRLLAFGLGQGEAAREVVLQRAFEAAARAGAKSLALSIDWLGETPELAAQAWAPLAQRARFERQILIGDPRSLGKAVRAAIGEGTGLQLDGEAMENQKKRA